jgi:hypothetical protein
MNDVVRDIVDVVAVAVFEEAVQEEVCTED